jgi:hypothetical protein
MLARLRLLLLAALLGGVPTACGGAAAEPVDAPAAAPPAAGPIAEEEPETPTVPADEPEDGGAELWVTRDRGQTVVLTASVPSGLTALQALDREAEIETRYSGRYVSAIAGIEGSLSEQADWFYFVNGIEPDVGAAELRLRPGDVLWWDFRSWAEEMESPVVVGAFPEPLVHGYEGRTRPVTVSAPAELADAAAALAEAYEVAGEDEPHRLVLEVRPGASGATLTAERGAANDAPVTFRLSGSEGAVRAAALRLAREPEVVRFRYEATFDESGELDG